MRQVSWDPAQRSTPGGGPGAGQYPPALKWDQAMRQASIDRYLALTRAHWGKRLLIWPETAVPDFLHRVLEPLLEPRPGGWPPWEQPAGGDPVHEPGDPPVLQRGLRGGQRGGLFQTSSGAVRGIPALQALLGPLLSFMEIPMSDFSAGRRGPALVRVAGHWVGVSICYEDAFGGGAGGPAGSGHAREPEQRRLVRGFLAPHQHLQIARLRALETGGPRCAPPTRAFPP